MSNSWSARSANCRTRSWAKSFTDRNARNLHADRNVVFRLILRDIAGIAIVNVKVFPANVHEDCHRCVVLVQTGSSHGNRGTDIEHLATHQLVLHVCVTDGNHINCFLDDDVKRDRIGIHASNVQYFCTNRQVLRHGFNDHGSGLVNAVRRSS